MFLRRTVLIPWWITFIDFLRIFLFAGLATKNAFLLCTKYYQYTRGRFSRLVTLIDCQDWWQVTYVLTDALNFFCRGTVKHFYYQLRDYLGFCGWSGLHFQQRKVQKASGQTSFNSFACPIFRFVLTKQLFLGCPLVLLISIKVFFRLKLWHLPSSGSNRMLVVWVQVQQFQAELNMMVFTGSNMLEKDIAPLEICQC